MESTRFFFLWLTWPSLPPKRPGKKGENPSDLPDLTRFQWTTLDVGLCPWIFVKCHLVFFFEIHQNQLVGVVFWGSINSLVLCFGDLSTRWCCFRFIFLKINLPCFFSFGGRRWNLNFSGGDEPFFFAHHFFCWGGRMNPEPSIFCWKDDMTRNFNNFNFRTTNLNCFNQPTG